MPSRIPFMRLSEDTSREDEMRNGSFNDARCLWINFFFERFGGRGLYDRFPERQIET